MVADPAKKKPSTVAFPAIVGQHDLKRVLLLSVVHGGLGGALITGEKGTAKSTAVRGLADLLGEQRVVADCPYGCAPNDPASQCEHCRSRPHEELPVETRPVPLVTLPLGATRDRVVGTLSIEDAMAGESAFDPGLLARANRGILYVDEINLLDDHLVDVLLDAAASGVNTVERDGMSVSHPAAFTLIGTMNPEEGDLRPQLRDRFDLQATVTGCQDLDDRVEIIDRVLAGDAETTISYDTEATDAANAANATDDDTAQTVADLRKSLRVARESVGSVSLPTEFKQSIAELCVDAGVDGHRADIATARAAIALAALNGRPKVIGSDVREAAQYTLPHRLQSQPFGEPPDPEELLADHFGDDGSAPPNEPDTDSDAGDEIDETAESDTDDNGDGGDDSDGSGGADEHPAPANGDTDGKPDASGGSSAGDGADGDGEQPPQYTEQGEDEPTKDGGDENVEHDDSDADDDADDNTDATPLLPGETRAAIGEAAAPDLDSREPPTGNGSAETTTQLPGSHGRDQRVGGRGTRIRTERAADDDAIDAAASVRAAASQGHSRVERDDLRQSIRERDTAATIVFAVDASASMRPAMRAAKGVVLELLRDAYQQRDAVAFVAFGGDDAEVLLPPTRSLSLAARHLKELPTGDRTPLPAGLDAARQVVDSADSSLGIVVLVTDGRANVADGSPTQATRRAARRLAASGAQVVIVDTGADQRGGLVGTIADETDGRTVSLSALTAETVSAAVSQAAANTD